MNTKKMFFMVMLLLSAWGIQQLNAQKALGPEFTPKVTVVDFGDVDGKNDTGYRMLDFTNTGSDVLLITKTEGSCGCTTPETPTAPFKPGSTGSLKIKYDINRKGTFSKTVTITTNEEDGKNPDGTVKYKQHTILVKGNVL